MTKIREIIERNSFTDTHYEPEDFIIFERDFDKLEKELEEYVDGKVEEERKQGDKRWIKATKLMIQKAVEEDNWISVEDELPKEDSDVITVNTDGQVQQAFFGCSGWDGYVYKNEEVTHWQPLPKPQGVSND